MKADPGAGSETSAALASSPSRVVIRTPNWLGDAVMALPAIAAVRRAFPTSVLAIAAPVSLAPMFEEETPAAQDELLALGPVLEERRALRDGRFDVALLLPNSFRSAWVARQAGIPARWGYRDNTRRWLLTRAVSKPKGKRHQSEYYLELVRGLDIEAPSSVPRITVRSSTLRRADEFLARNGVADGTPIVGFAPGAAYGHAKRWLPSRVAEVIARMRRERGAVSLLLGAGGDRDAGREIESALPPDTPAVNLIGRTDLRLLAGVMARCRAFASNDSGAMHLAAAIGVPVAAIFGPTDDRVTAPLGNHDVLIHQVFCRPCMLRDCPIDHRCMKGITVDAVFGALSARLDAAPRAAEHP
jgi:heptosyltransferase-2